VTASKWSSGNRGTRLDIKSKDNKDNDTKEDNDEDDSVPVDVKRALKWSLAGVAAGLGRNHVITCYQCQCTDPYFVGNIHMYNDEHNGGSDDVALTLDKIMDPFTGVISSPIMWSNLRHAHVASGYQSSIVYNDRTISSYQHHLMSLHHPPSGKGRHPGVDVNPHYANSHHRPTFVITNMNLVEERLLCQSGNNRLSSTLHHPHVIKSPSILLADQQIVG
jgi:hypothetical protein